MDIFAPKPSNQISNHQYILFFTKSSHLFFQLKQCQSYVFYERNGHILNFSSRVLWEKGLCLAQFFIPCQSFKRFNLEWNNYVKATLYKTSVNRSNFCLWKQSQFKELFSKSMDNFDDKPYMHKTSINMYQQQIKSSFQCKWKLILFIDAHHSSIKSSYYTMESNFGDKFKCNGSRILTKR